MYNNCKSVKIFLSKKIFDDFNYTGLSYIKWEHWCKTKLKGDNEWTKTSIFV